MERQNEKTMEGGVVDGREEKREGSSGVVHERGRTRTTRSSLMRETCSNEDHKKVHGSRNFSVGGERNSRESSVFRRFFQRSTSMKNLNNKAVVNTANTAKKSAAEHAVVCEGVEVEKISGGVGKRDPDEKNSRKYHTVARCLVRNLFIIF